MPTATAAQPVSNSITPKVSNEWWDRAYFEQGATSMDKLISKDASWEEIVASAEQDLLDAFAIGGLNAAPEGDLLEIGCGVGRISHALSTRFRHVYGLDITPRLLEEARRKQTVPNVSYHLVDGTTLMVDSLLNEARSRSPQGLSTVFSYEVLYYVPTTALQTYFKDAFELLKPAGELVFQLNCVPISAKTRLGFKLRDYLYAAGITQWRGWPTHPDFRRIYRSESQIRQWLINAGFSDITICGSPAQRWFRGTKSA